MEHFTWNNITKVAFLAFVGACISGNSVENVSLASNAGLGAFATGVMGVVIAIFGNRSM